MSLRLGETLIAGTNPVPTGAMTFKGSVLQANLPTSGQRIGDYYKLTDTVAPYAGQCAIWNETAWDYSSGNMEVDSTLSTTSVNPVENRAVAVALNGRYTKDEVYSKSEVDNFLKNIKQIVYNGIYPVNSIVFGFQAPGIPDGVTATWSDVSITYDGMFFKVVAGANPGTTITERGTANSTVLTIDQIPAHDHRATTYDNVGYTDWRGDHTHYHQGGVDVYENQSGYGNKYTLATSGDYSGGRDLYMGTAGGHWHQAISNGGGKGHTHTLSGISPLATSIKIWKRVA